MYIRLSFLQLPVSEAIVKFIKRILLQVYRKFSRVKVRFKERTENVKDEVT